MRSEAGGANSSGSTPGGATTIGALASGYACSISRRVDSEIVMIRSARWMDRLAPWVSRLSVFSSTYCGWCRKPRS